MSDADLYETDFCQWAETQAQAIRNAREVGVNLPLDWVHLAEEIEGLSGAQRRELRNRLSTLIEHLLKLQYSPSPDARGGWRSTIRRTRDRIADILDENPSLRREIAPMTETEIPRVAKRIAADLNDRGEVPPALIAEIAGTTSLRDDLLADWFPPGSDIQPN